MNPPAADSTPERRADIDWLRVIAIGLLVAYHIAIVFQPWADEFGFIRSERSLPGLWLVMGALNVWRIPLLFFVSGMGVRFAIRRRDFRGLVKERSRRILLPLLFGSLAIVPIHVALLLHATGQTVVYFPFPGHLWFLANIFLYVLLLGPLLVYLHRRPTSWPMRAFDWIASRPAALPLLALPFVVEALLVQPPIYELYAYTGHGFWLGLIAFGLGFATVFGRGALWPSAVRVRFVALGLALALYAVRLVVFELSGPPVLTAVESMSWLLATFGFAFAHLHRPGPRLNYLREAGYPIYIVHMAVLYAAATLVLPLGIAVELQLLLVAALTFGGCFALYEFVIRRVAWLRPAFGLRSSSEPAEPT